MANATALGAQVEITQMAVGDGNGALPTPNPAQTALVHELRRAPLNTLSIDPNNANQIIAEQVIPEDVGGWWIREIGLFDKDGDMIAVANCAETYKPQLQEGSGRVQIVRMILIVSSTAAVTLKIDPSVVLATRQYVDSQIIQVKTYVDQQLAAHIAANDPHTQYAPKESPQLTGKPTTPTADGKDNSTQIANTAFVQLAIAALVGSSPEALDTLNELAAALGNDPNFATTMTNQLAEKMTKSENGADIPNKSVFLQNLGLPDAIPGRFLRRRFITTSGTYSPPSDVRLIKVHVIGGGGGGGAAGQTNSGYTAIGGGGGAGGYSSRVVTVGAGFQTVNVTIGAGGIPGGQSGYSGGAGGVTSFGSYGSASGGDGGAGTSATNNASYIMSGGAGGLGANGEVNAYGSPGGTAIMPPVNGGISGAGGSSNISSGPGGRVGNAGGNDGVYGSGGSGGISQVSASTQYGGRGGAGLVIVEEFS
nr:phage tail protein [Enterobacter roggenkampii]